MSKETNHIDELFKARLNSDMPVYRDEYWQSFEQMLDNLPASSSSGNSPGDAGASSAAGTSSAGTSTAGSTAAAGSSAAVSTGASGGFGSLLTGGLLVKAVIGISTAAMLSTAVWYGVQEIMPEKATIPAQIPTVTQQPLAPSEHLSEEPNRTVSDSSIQNSTNSAPSAHPNSGLFQQASAANNKEISVDNPAVAQFPAKSNKPDAVKPLNQNKLTKPVPADRTDKGSQTPDETAAVSRNDLADPAGKATGKDLDIPPAGESGTLPVTRTETTGTSQTESGKSQTESEGTETQPVSVPQVKEGDNDISLPETTALTVPSDSARPETIANPAAAQAAILPSLVPAANPATSPFGLTLTGGTALAKSIGNTSGFDPNWHASLYIGIGMEMRLNSHLSLYVEPGVHRLSGWELNQQSEQTYIFFDNQSVVTTIQNRELEVFSLPLMLRYSLGRHNFAAGPSLMVLLSASGESDIRVQTPSGLQMTHDKATNFLGGLNRLQYGIGLDYSLNLYRQHAAFVRYAYYLNGTLRESADFMDYPDQKIGVILLGVRIKAL